VIGCDDVAFRDMVLPCNLSERLVALDDNERRDRGTGGPPGAWAIARRTGGRRNIRTFPARGQERTAAQYQRRDQGPVQLHRSRSPRHRAILRRRPRRRFFSPDDAKPDAGLAACPLTALLVGNPEPPGPPQVRVRPTRMSACRTTPRLAMASPRAHQHPAPLARLTGLSWALVAQQPLARWGDEHRPSPCWRGGEDGPRQWLLLV
jgi:hypothetical protein